MFHLERSIDTTCNLRKEKKKNVLFKQAITISAISKTFPASVVVCKLLSRRSNRRCIYIYGYSYPPLRATDVNAFYTPLSTLPSVNVCQCLVPLVITYIHNTATTSAFFPLNFLYFFFFFYNFCLLLTI